MPKQHILLSFKILKYSHSKEWNTPNVYIVPLHVGMFERKHCFDTMKTFRLWRAAKNWNHLLSSSTWTPRTSIPPPIYSSPVFTCMTLFFQECSAETNSLIVYYRNFPKAHHLFNKNHQLILWTPCIMSPLVLDCFIWSVPSSEPHFERPTLNHTSKSQ